MTALIASVLAIAGISLSLGSPIIGAVMARRAARRYGWSEAKVAYRAFLSILVLVVLSSAALIAIGLFGELDVYIELSRWVELLFTTANMVVLIAIAVSLYRLARRGSESATEKSSSGD